MKHYVDYVWGITPKVVKKERLTSVSMFRQVASMVLKDKIDKRSKNSINA